LKTSENAKLSFWMAVLLPLVSACTAAST